MGIHPYSIIRNSFHCPKNSLCSVYSSLLTLINAFCYSLFGDSISLMWVLRWQKSWMYSRARCELLNYEWHCGILWGLRPLKKAVLRWELHQDCVSGWKMPQGWAWAGLNAGNGDRKSKCRGRAGGRGARSLKVPPVHRAVTTEGASGFQVYYAQFHRGYFFKASSQFSCTNSKWQADFSGPGKG